MKAYRTIWENLLSLLGLQVVNYLLPLVSFPYIVRVVGIDGFGLFSFIFSINQYFVILTDYGFNLTATRDISIARHEPQRVSEIFSAVIIIKSLFLLASIILMTGAVLMVPKLHEHWTLYMLSMLSVLGNVLFPVWFFQGVELTKYIAVINGAVKLVATACIFLFVKVGSDLSVLVFIQSVGVVVAGVASLLLIWRQRSVRLVWPSSGTITRMMRSGREVFLTIISSTLVNNTNIFLLGMLTDNMTVGFFSIADRIVRVFISLCAPVSTAIFPYVSKGFGEDRKKTMSFLRRVLTIGGLAFGCFVMVLLIAPDLLVRIVTGSDSSRISLLVRIMSVVPLSIFIDNLYGTQILINVGRTSDFLKAVFIPGVLSVLAALVVYPVFKDLGAAVVFTVAELMILVFMIHYVRGQQLYLVRDGWL